MKSLFFKKTNKSDKLLAGQTKKQREKTQKRNITTDTAKIQKDHQRLLWTIVYWQTGKPGGYG